MKKAVNIFLALCLAVLMSFAVFAMVYPVIGGEAVAYAATDDNSQYDLDWDNTDLTKYTQTVKDEPAEKETSVAPIIVVSVAAAACVGVGVAFAVITARRKKK